MAIAPITGTIKRRVITDISVGIFVFLFDGSIQVLDVVSLLIKSKLLPYTKNHTISFILTNHLMKTNELIVENLGLKGDLELFEWNTSIPLIIEDDLISLNLKYGGLKELFLNDSIEPIQLLADSLLNLIIKSDYKIRITNTFLKGSFSIKFWKIFNNLYDRHLNSLDPIHKKLINDQDETLFLDQYSFFNRNIDFVCFDRGVDLISCLLTQLTYTGLTDDIIGTDMGIVNFPILNPETNELEEFKLSLGDSNDFIYPLIKNLNFSMVGSILNSKAKEIQKEFDKRNSLNDIDSMKKFVGELNLLKDNQRWVQKHTTLAEFILQSVKKGEDDDSSIMNEIDIPSYNYFNQFIELQQDILSDNLDNKKNCNLILEFMYKFEPKIQDIIKLLILTTIVKKGIREFEYDYMKSEILNLYGLKYLKLFIRLKELKLVYNKETTSFLSGPSIIEEQSFDSIQLINDFRSISNYLNLMPIVDQQDLNNPKDADFGLPGFVPIITRLIEAIYDRDFLSATTSLTTTTTTSSSSHTNHRPKTRLRKYGWDNLDLSNLNGEVKQDFLITENKKKLFDSIIPPKLSNLTNRKDVIIVSVIGGLTYSEISTIRFILQKNEVTKDKQLIILTTGVIKSDDVINCLI
ncbi:hypothetical protein CANARDRAFT_195880 [[Candida] arabinofermentans NRRL YB-2248]|uniref:Sec1-like protein n=1 Tax=[Candida] arabinofermentans NRRL YB-2248 TaxID=983967 RepID=A0A1E4T4E3_9ASCO|nr:hypothetical protein CANARDRAFT_195880 [[Candida] arabinofermentans NRRL YB-2248]